MASAPRLNRGRTGTYVLVPTSPQSVLDLQVAADLTGPRAARQRVASHFAGSPVLEDLLLCLSEVVTNAVMHALPPIRVHASTDGGTTRVEVSDGSTVPPRARAAPPPDRLATSGRGLHLVERLATRWGVEVGERGKTVWFEFG